jgi:malate dehydrogenase (oxaloacetate-decarboxylating)(NADP+)
MFYTVARTLADQISKESLAVGRLFPDLKVIREISIHIAAAVCEVAFEQGIAGIGRPDDLLPYIHARMFQPHYVPYKPA